ncbi:MAG: hypothetical protein F2872_02515 [Actinobacteria bacterium]|nr:hypothetical protein [Actinomycetota bacterium]
MTRALSSACTTSESLASPALSCTSNRNNPRAFNEQSGADYSASLFSLADMLCEQGTRSLKSLALAIKK